MLLTKQETFMKKLQLLVLTALLGTVSQAYTWSWFSGDSTVSVYSNGVVVVNGQTMYAPNGITVVNGQVVYPANATVITDAGESETKKIDISDVKDIDASSFGNLYIEQCRTCPEILTMTAGKNIMPHLKHEISGIFNKQLNLGFKDNVVIQTQTLPSVNFHAVVKNINKISTSNSIEATTNNIETSNLELNMRNSSTLNSSIKANNLKLKMANSSEATLTGKVDEQNLTLSNSAEYNAQNLASQNAHITISNSALARLNVIKNLYYKASNSSKIFYQGNAKAEGSTSNSAKIRQI